MKRSSLLPAHSQYGLRLEFINISYSKTQFCHPHIQVNLRTKKGRTKKSHEENFVTEQIYVKN